jgi:hypothetical protein
LQFAALNADEAEDRLDVDEQPARTAPTDTAAMLKAVTRSGCDVRGWEVDMRVRIEWSF